MISADESLPLGLCKETVKMYKITKSHITNSGLDCFIVPTRGSAKRGLLKQFNIGHSKCREISRGLVIHFNDVMWGPIILTGFNFNPSMDNQSHQL